MGSEKGAELSDDALVAILSKLETRSARVGLVGLGYVGLPLALLFARRGFRTTGFDIDSSKVEKLMRGESYIRHLPGAAVAGQLRNKHFQATSDFTRLKEMGAIIICVPTPLDAHREPDLTYVRNTAEVISSNLRRGQVVVLESTTYPGTTEEVVLPILEKSGLRCAVASYPAEGTSVQTSESARPDFFLAFSPEREDPGNKEFEIHQVPKIIGALNAPSALAAEALYKHAFDRTILVSSTRVAEMVKLLENIYRCVNIALVNELKLLCLRMGIDIWEVIEAAKSKPFGFAAFDPGPGLGGHCIPIDPFYLTWKAKEYEFPTRFIELAGEVNAAMPEHVVATVAEALDQRSRCLKGSKILILGVAYKKDVDDVRESPALRIMELLLKRGAQVDYHDPYVPRTHKMRSYDFHLASVELTPDSVGAYDAVLITTAHSNIDYAAVVRHARLVIDTRNATQGIREHRDKIVRC